MRDIARDNRLLSLVSKTGLRNLLTTMLDQLQRCQKSLNEFLEVIWLGCNDSSHKHHNFRKNVLCFRASISSVTMIFWRFLVRLLTLQSYRHIWRNCLLVFTVWSLTRAPKISQLWGHWRGKLSPSKAVWWLPQMLRWRSFVAKCFSIVKVVQSSVDCCQYGDCVA